MSLWVFGGFRGLRGPLDLWVLVEFLRTVGLLAFGGSRQANPIRSSVVLHAKRTTKQHVISSMELNLFHGICNQFLQRYFISSDVSWDASLDARDHPWSPRPNWKRLGADAHIEPKYSSSYLTRIRGILAPRPGSELRECMLS